MRRIAPAKAARRILDEQNIIQPPVNVEKIIKLMGIALASADLPDQVSGILHTEGTKSIILVNEFHYENRQRFTMAHELGHYVLHKNQGIHIDKRTFSRNAQSQTGLDPIEIEANRFAAELLMPKAFIEERMREYENMVDLIDANEDIIGKLANEFKVSIAAMSIRLQSLGYLPQEF